MKNIADIRKDYKLEKLDDSEMENDAVVQFQKWWQQALESNIDEVNAMTLSTVNRNKSSSRIVLLKALHSDGFVFFTNYESNKGQAIKENPHVSLVFFWKELERQVRVEGIAEKTSAEESDAYFASRPEGSKIGAWASPQSKVIFSRAMLEQEEAIYREKFAGQPIPRPSHWGGYVVKAEMIEFWQGRPGRLHDRIRYSREAEVSGKDQLVAWRKERLAP